jgi:DNA-binding FadR family transcriptional regulator
MNLRPVPRPSGLFDQVVAQLRHQITSGAWPMGSRIPTEPELVEQLEVARNTVREAVRALAHNGLLLEAIRAETADTAAAEAASHTSGCRFGR